MEATPTIYLDAVIFGGGCAGLWLLDEFRRGGRRVLLLESGALGSGQTIASQGILHSGLKYTLSGLLTTSARTIAEMPVLWRDCLAGRGEPDLSAVRMRAEFCHLWRSRRLRSRLAMIGARAGLRVTPETVADEDRPAALAGCPGILSRLDEQVIDPRSLIEVLRDRNAQFIWSYDEFTINDRDLATLAVQSGEQRAELHASHVILTAGAGNDLLRDQFGLTSTASQRRPLHMVMVRGDLPPLNGHCVDGTSTRTTITSDQDESGETVWQVGGQLAETGVERGRDEQIRFASSELNAVLPGVDLTSARWATYRVDRAEARHGGARPNDVSILQEGNIFTAWPTKLALAPRLAEQLQAQLPVPQSLKPIEPTLDALDWPAPTIAKPPWETCELWSSD